MSIDDVLPLLAAALRKLPDDEARRKVLRALAALF